MKNVVKFYLSPKGRLGRKEFILYFYGPWLLTIAIINSVPFSLVPSETIELLLYCFLLITLWPYLATLIKRFHDFDKSALFVFFVYIIVSFFFVLGIKEFKDIAVETVGYHDLVILAIGLVFVFAIFLILLFPAIFPGNDGSNKYDIVPSRGG